MDDAITLRRGDIQRLLSPPSRPDPHIPEKTLGEGSQVVYLYYNPSERALHELLGRPYWPCKVGMTHGPDGWARISTQKKPSTPTSCPKTDRFFWTLAGSLGGEERPLEGCPALRGWALSSGVVLPCPEGLVDDDEGSQRVLPGGPGLRPGCGGQGQEDPQGGGGSHRPAP